MCVCKIVCLCVFSKKKKQTNKQKRISKAIDCYVNLTPGKKRKKKKAAENNNNNNNNNNNEEEDEEEVEAQNLRLSIYRENFESQYLDSLTNYYTSKGCQNIADMSTSQYLVFVENALKAEDNRVRQHMHTSSNKPVAATCESVSIKVFFFFCLFYLCMCVFRVVFLFFCFFLFILLFFSL